MVDQYLTGDRCPRSGDSHALYTIRITFMIYRFTSAVAPAILNSSLNEVAPWQAEKPDLLITVALFSLKIICPKTRDRGHV